MNPVSESATENYTSRSVTTHRSDVNVDNSDVLLFTCVLTTLDLLGVCGNIIGAIVLGKVQKTSPGVRLLKYLCFIDIAVLIGILMDQVLSFYSGRHRRMRVIMEGLKSITFPVGLTLYTLEIYFTVLVACQRSVALAKPLLSPVYMRNSIINKLIFAIVVVSIVYNIPYWLIYKRGVYWNEEISITWITWAYSDFQRSAFFRVYDNYITLFFRAIIPMTALIICIIIIIISARRRNISQTRRNGGDHLTSVNVAIITMSVLTHVTTAVERMDILRIEHFEQVTALLVILNCSTNFIFYCAFGSAFRRTISDDIRALYRRCKCCTAKENHRVNGIQVFQDSPHDTSF